MLLSRAKQILMEAGYRLNEDYEGDIYIEIEDSLSNMGYNALEIQKLMADFADYINDLIQDGLSADEIAEKLDENEE